VLGDDGAREVSVPGGAAKTVLGWTALGRVALLVYTSPDFSISPDNPVTLWTEAADGSGARREVRGAFLPFGLSPDGQTVYALGDNRTIPDARFGGANGWTSLLAVDRATGTTRILATAEDLATQLGFAPAVAQWLDTVSLAPNGAQIALVVHTLAVPVTPPGEELSLETAVLTVSAEGQLGAWERVLANARPTVFAWGQPPASRLAFTLYSTQTGFRQIHILGQPLAYQPGDVAGNGNTAPQWSPDGQWLVYAGPDGLELAAATAPARSVLLATDGHDPAWSPR
jgi:hypothetical protein